MEHSLDARDITKRLWVNFFFFSLFAARPLFMLSLRSLGYALFFFGSNPQSTQCIYYDQLWEKFALPVFFYFSRMMETLLCYENDKWEDSSSGPKTLTGNMWLDWLYSTSDNLVHWQSSRLQSWFSDLLRRSVDPYLLWHILMLRYCQLTLAVCVRSFRWSCDLQSVTSMALLPLHI